MNTSDQNIITWTIITSFSKRTYAFNKMVKHDKTLVNNQFNKHHANIDKAKAFIAELENTGTQFNVFYITDKQFGEQVINYKK